VGITYTADGQTDAEGNLVYSEYPVVASVDPGSPAASAGLSAGDTIIAFNDRDLKRYALPLRSMIQPGKPFVIRFRRDRERTVKLIVAQRPSERREFVEITMQPMIPGVPAPFVLTPGPMRAGIRVPTTRAVLGVAGAEVRSLSVDLAKTLGIKPQGLFIVNVAEGSPAKEAGLRDGDVLLRAAEQNLLTPQDLQQILQMDINRSVRLDLVRQKKPQSVVLRW
jgi:serine protease Do